MNDKEIEDEGKIKENERSYEETINRFQKKSFLFEIISFVVVIVILLIFLFNS